MISGGSGEIIAVINKFSTILRSTIKTHERCDCICSVNLVSPQVRHIFEQANRCEIVEAVHHLNAIEGTASERPACLWRQCRSEVPRALRSCNNDQYRQIARYRTLRAPHSLKIPWIEYLSFKYDCNLRYVKDYLPTTLSQELDGRPCQESQIVPSGFRQSISIRKAPSTTMG